MRIVVALIAVLGLAGCSSEPTGPIADFEKLAKTMCDCTDIRCAKGVAERMRASSERLRKPNMPAGDLERMEKARARATECRRDVSRAEYRKKFGKPGKAATPK